MPFRPARCSSVERRRGACSLPPSKTSPAAGAALPYQPCSVTSLELPTGLPQTSLRPTWVEAALDGGDGGRPVGVVALEGAAVELAHQRVDRADLRVERGIHITPYTLQHGKKGTVGAWRRGAALPGAEQSAAQAASGRPHRWRFTPRAPTFAATGSTSWAPSSAACLWGMVTLKPIQSASARAVSEGGGGGAVQRREGVAGWGGTRRASSSAGAASACAAQRNS